MKVHRVLTIFSLTALILITGLCVPKLSGAQSSNQLATTICGDTPDVAATDWQQLFPTSSDPNRCPSLCQLWVRTCMTAAHVAHACYMGEFLQESILAKAQCEGDPTCLANEQAFLKTERATELDLMSQGTATCLGALQTCISACGS